MSNILSFDTHAWMSNMELRECHPEDRGILIDLMCLAHHGTPYGHIAKGGVAKQPANIAAHIRIGVAELEQAIARLLACGRIGIADHTGAIYVPRMVRDGAIFLAAKEGGSRGGNPALLPEEKPTQRRAKPITVAAYMLALPLHLQTDSVKESVREWLEYRQRRRIVLTENAVTRQASQLAQLSPEQACQWIQCAIDRNWQGFYPPPEARQSRFSSDTKTTTATPKEFTGHAQPRIISHA